MTSTEPVAPDFSAVAGSGLYAVVGALLTVALTTAIMMVVVCVVWWAIAHHTSSWHQASKARLGVLLALGGAALVGSAIAVANWLLVLGADLSSNPNG